MVRYFFGLYVPNVRSSVRNNIMTTLVFTIRSMIRSTSSKVATLATRMSASPGSGPVYSLPADLVRDYVTIDDFEQLKEAVAIDARNLDVAWVILCSEYPPSYVAKSFSGESAFAAAARCSTSRLALHAIKQQLRLHVE